MAPRPFSSLNLALLAVFILLVILTHSVWMGWMGAFLVDSERPSHADVIVVLAGDPYGHRILRAAELVKQGYATKVLVSGPGSVYDLHECDLAIPFVVRHGYPAAWFLPVPHSAHSTQEEVRAILPVLEKVHAHTVIAVTSDYHTRRALRAMHAAWPGIQVHMVAAGDEFFSPYGWWHSREGRKIFFLEWTKTFASLVGL
ncbi:MAG: YdcF family protein [Acidobacteriia bacterium]|nr:YdcF family protein [Terriglobia bacterium]